MTNTPLPEPLETTNEFFMLQVCKYWNVLALDGSSWQKINLFDFQRDIEVSLGFGRLLMENNIPIINYFLYRVQ